MDSFTEDQRVVNVQANREIDIVENSLNKELDGFQSEIDKKFDILQESISKLTNQIIYQKEENPEKECLIDTIVEEQYKMQDEAISPLMTEEGSGKETVEGTQKPILQPISINLDPNVIAKPKNSPLPVHILPSPVAQSTAKTPTTKATQFVMPALKNFKTLGATVQAYATTSMTLTFAYVAWHSGWFGCWFRFGAPEPQHF